MKASILILNPVVRTGCFVDKLRKLDNHKLNLKGPDADALIVPSRGTHLMLPGSFSSKNVGMLIPKTKDVCSLRLKG